ncbi:MAG TPA: error-prone DNA polymerase [Jiangellaceae bacterium]|nr:error-prone DNA polymerase [Jiangellaceae bacterium]
MGFFNPVIPWRELEQKLTWGSGWRAEEQLPTSSDESAPSVPDPAREGDAPPWAELHCHSAFSFLDGVSEPEALVAEAARLGVETIGLTDHDGFYGVVQLAQAAAEAGIGTVFGAELSLGLDAPRTGQPDPDAQHLVVLARNPEGYRRLGTVLTAAQMRGSKARPVYDAAEILDAAGGPHADHWAVLTGCRKSAVPRALAEHGEQAAEEELRALVEHFGRQNVYVEVIDHAHPLDGERNDALAALAATVGVGVVASNNVHHATPAEAPLAQTMAAVRAGRSLDDMLGWLPTSGMAHLRGGQEMERRLQRFPGVREATVELARACAFDLRLVAPNLPDRDVPPGYTEREWLRECVRVGALERYGARTEQTESAYRQLDDELDVIEELDFPGYFLIVHEITQFCRSQNILCQGRGSAANSAVCYALGITSVDPIQHQLLFERFLSTARDGPPDIDIDIENGRREEVIQHVYQTYGRDRAAQVANVISYRPKMALRDAGRALGHSPGQLDGWSRRVFNHDPLPEDAEIPDQLLDLVAQMQHLPRHLGIHSGGMVLCDRPVGQVCPVEWASMPGRSVLQWDKDDCAAAGLVKFDLLGLGMLSALHDALDLLAAHHGVDLALHTVPADDAPTYAMLGDADSVGTFQVESRAQMATLPRLRPKRFYDLVVEVALIRPGPIQGGSVHTYLRRRNGQEPVTYPHPLMQPALERTLGVPLFQEQMMQLAIDCAGFAPVEADQLRQAMSSKRAPERIEAFHARLLEGMAERGIGPEIAEDIYAKLFGFASYGFPESHAYSFAHLVYASSYLKRHYPAAFTVGLLRNQPMGFYSPQSLIADARRHGVQIRGVDVNASAAQAGLEEAVPVESTHPHAPDDPQPAIRMGLSSVRGLGEEAAEKIAAGAPYDDLADVVRRTGVSLPALEALATAGAFDSFGLDRRAALWSVGALVHSGPEQIPGTTPGGIAPALPAMTAIEETFADLWATGTSPASHPVHHVRDHLDQWGTTPTGDLATARNGSRLTVGGLVTHRQRPPTAGGVLFMNIEDETGMVNVICPPNIWERRRKVVLESAALLVEGRLERVEGAINLLAQRIRPLRVATPTRSRDFR